ncbi:hypothetical protein CTEN210_01984 [Chaetoceros tenuissimus]|uniref:Uncharacterized protein n=1 Tax=Chaetoceros tenuissimus TaxID=426638 RepID=A0AAD3CIZ8_9STRA|nr:hypothetical protein CTEN210_01984 [Chaetoceros tenuissimus]
MESKEQLAGIMTSETRPKFYRHGNSLEDMASMDHNNKEAGVLFSTSVKTLTTVDSQNHTSRSASISSTESDSAKRISKPVLKNTVSFGVVEFRVHDRTVGDNPSVANGGAALDLDWDYSEGPSVTLEEFENHRTNIQPRREKSELLIRRREREKMLRYDHGVTRQEIASATRSINKQKANRRQTNHNLKYQSLEEAAEKAKRFAQRLVGARKSTKKEIKKLWKHADKNMEKSVKKGRKLQKGYSSHSSTSLHAKAKNVAKKVVECHEDSDVSTTSRNKRLFKKKSSGSSRGSKSLNTSRHSLKKHDLTLEPEQDVSSTRHVSKNYSDLLKNLELNDDSEETLVVENLRSSAPPALGGGTVSDTSDLHTSATRHVKNYDLSLEAKRDQSSDISCEQKEEKPNNQATPSNPLVKIFRDSDHDAATVTTCSTQSTNLNQSLGSSMISEKSSARYLVKKNSIITAEEEDLFSFGL